MVHETTVWEIISKSSQQTRFLMMMKTAGMFDFEARLSGLGQETKRRTPFTGSDRRSQVINQLFATRQRDQDRCYKMCIGK